MPKRRGRIKFSADSHSSKTSKGHGKTGDCFFCSACPEAEN
jgi:hypothetical protein